MAKILSIDNMLEAAQQCDLPGLVNHVDDLELAATRLAKALADHLKIKTHGANWEGEAFGGICASFYPITPDQPCPQVIDEGDEGGDWEPHNGPMRCAICKNYFPDNQGRYHQENWICDPCWDNRPKPTE